MATMYYRPYSTELVKDGELPSESAMENVVSEHSYILPDDQPSKPPSQPARETAVKVLQPLAGTSVLVQTSRNENHNDSRFMVVEGQMAELDRYRSAVQKMGHDILGLRERIRVLEGENSILRRDLAAYNDTSRILLDSVELDGLPKSDLISRYVTLKQRLTSSTAELSTYKEKVQKLQNDLIKKNQKEENYLRMSRAHTSQQDLLQKLQEKVARVKKLEEACQQQEKVIERMEKLLQKAPKQKAPKQQSQRRPNMNAGTSPHLAINLMAEGEADSEEINATLVEENRRLRRELEEWKEHATSKTKQGAGMEDAERLELYQLLDKAEGRIVSLERQMNEQARKWGKDKEVLVNRLREYEFGLSSPMNSLPSNLQTPARQSRMDDLAHSRRRL